MQKTESTRQLIIRLLALLLIISMPSCQKEIKQQEKFYRPVKYQEVAYLNTNKVRSFSGTAQTDKIIHLSFRNTGIITKHNMKLGQRVRKGQLLGRLDNVQARLAHEQAITQLNAAESLMNTTKLTLIGIACIGLLLVLMCFIGLISQNLKITLSTLPFLMLSAYVIFDLWKTRKQSSQ